MIVFPSPFQNLSFCNPIVGDKLEGKKVCHGIFINPIIKKKKTNYKLLALEIFIFSN